MITIRFLANIHTRSTNFHRRFSRNGDGYACPRRTWPAPLAAKAAILKPEWHVVVDRCLGFVELVESFPDDAEGQVFIRDILYVMVDIYETARACRQGASQPDLRRYGVVTAPDV